MPYSCRHRVGFGKRIEFFIMAKMLKEGLDVFVPLVDDDGTDALILRPNNSSVIAVQIKAISKDVKDGSAANFAAITHEKRDNYWFVFYSERMEMMWIMNSEEFLKESGQNKNGKNKGKRNIWFNGGLKDKTTDKTKEYCKEKFEKYIAQNFERFK